ncbi:sperm-associated microtubule inner protein 4 [Rhinoraja longicauda]
MATAGLAPEDPFYYYQEAEGFRTLPPTFQSSELITPMQTPQRPTVSATRYAQYLENLPKIPRTPWGTEREYGGVKILNLPDGLRRKDEHPTFMEKGHRHFGYGGHPLPGDVIIDQYYDLTQLKRSQLRPTDQLLPTTKEFAMDQKQIRLPFPAEHPFHSHIPKFAIFPSFISPDDPYTGVRAGRLLPINPDMPAKSYNVTVTQKIKGFPFRHEKQEIFTQAKGLQWPGQEGYFQYPKSSTERMQTFYPTPPKSIAPNRSESSIAHAVSERTANILKNIEKSHWQSKHKRDFTGQGPMNPVQLDDYFDKKIAKVTGKYSYFTELKEQSRPTLMPNPPLRPMKKKDSVKEGAADDEFDYQCVDISPAPENIPAYEWADVKSQPLICEADSVPPNVETIANANEAVNWKNILCRTTTPPPNIYCPYSDLHMLRYKVEQKRNYEKPSAFYQHQKERIMDCWATPITIGSEEFAQLAERPNSVENDIRYADLPQSKLLDYTTKENHFSLNKPPSANDADDCEEEVQCLNRGILATRDLQPTSCPTENVELYRILQHPPPVEWGKMMICDDPKLRISKLKFPFPFNKTLEHKKLHEIVPEKPVDYRENIYSGRKHTFFGLNSSYFHDGML